MQINKILYSPISVTDLNNISEYIEFELLNPDAAINTVNAIIVKIDRLADFPDIGAQLSAIIDIDTDYRYLQSGNYLIFYRHLDSSVYIDRILYNRRDYCKILFNDSEL